MNSPLTDLPWNESVKTSPDLLRIIAIPRRVVTDEDAEELALEMTELLKKPNGKQKLRPVQARALYELGQYRWLVCTARVGAGKTLISLLSPYVMQSVRPLLIIPATLREKTLRDIKIYEKHWEVARIRIESYQALSRKNQADLFDKYRPDLIICDEAHFLRNTRAAVTKRLKRYLKEVRPGTPVAFMSGTLMNRSLRDFWHIVRYATSHNPAICPLPHNYDVLDEWASVVDEGVNEMNRVEPGELKQLYSEEEKQLENVVEAARSAIHRRLVDTPGWVATKEKFEGASIQIAPVRIEPDAEMKRALLKLRTDWETPDGEPIADGISIAKHAKELALGFYYRWNPRPPEDWLEARKAWCKVCRQILSNNRRNLDTELQVTEAIQGGQYPKFLPILEEWQKVKPSFVPNVETVWLSDLALDAAIDWSKKNPGIIWVAHRAFGKRLSEKSGMPYYLEEGRDASGRFIEDHPKGSPMIASIQSNKEGRNLQYKWSKNLVTNSPATGKWWEQLIGRTHRDGQDEDTVNVDVFYVILEHLSAFWKAVNDASFIQSLQGPQKLLCADNLMPLIQEEEDKNDE